MNTAHGCLSRLIDALARSLPQFDPTPLRANPPEIKDDGEDAEIIGEWLYEHLRAQGLADTLEWMRFNGETPDLKALADLDFSAFDAFWDAAYETAAGKVSMPWNWKFLEVMNGILQPHGLAIAGLVIPPAGDSTTLLCVTTDAAALENLTTCLVDSGLILIQYEPMTNEAALEALKHRGETEALASRLIRLTRPETEQNDKQGDVIDQVFSALSENLAAQRLTEHLVERFDPQDVNVNLVTDLLSVTLASKPLKWTFLSIRTTLKGLLALLVLGGVGWLGLSLGGYAELAGKVIRLATWGAGLLLVWCVTAVCILGMAVHRRRRQAR
ncbi:MAG: hypothetical protein LBQ81_03015 [Zoogloeaceae bacterium]|jgi:hypothetical protein|nr:hypothetical protein [Zoogloeaceae bacterium]